MIFTPYKTEVAAIANKLLIESQGWKDVELYKHVDENEVYGEGYYLKVVCPITDEEYIIDGNGDINDL